MSKKLRRNKPITLTAMEVKITAVGMKTLPFAFRKYAVARKKPEVKRYTRGLSLRLFSVKSLMKFILYCRYTNSNGITVVYVNVNRNKAPKSFGPIKT
ncbi:hypothetical protein D9M69_728990 [compost metagenome]